MRVNAVLVLILFCVHISSFARELRAEGSDNGITKGRYVTGGVVGSVVGFGIGHAIQKRYAKRRAWIFTATESAAVGFVFMSTFFACDGMTGAEHDSCMNRVNQRVQAGSLVFWGFHIWEIVDVWTGVKINEDLQKSVLLLPSLFNKNTPGLTLAVRF